MPRDISGLILAILFSSLSTLLLAEEAQHPKYASFSLENDIFNGADSGYTGGWGMGWGSNDYEAFNSDNTPGWILWLTQNHYISTKGNKTRAVSHFISQRINTPTDIRQEPLLVDDLPYSGLLSWKFTMHSYDQKIADRLSLTLGIIGPDSGAEAVHTEIHRYTDSKEPNGWRHQLHNEPVFRVEHWRHVRLFNWENTNGPEHDIIGAGFVGIGTLKSDVGAGISFRWGYGLSNTFPSVAMMPSREINVLAGKERNWHIFFNVLGRYVANDIAIDGNTFRSSHSVKLKHEQALAVLGFSYAAGNWVYHVSTATGSDTFDTQTENSRYSSFSLTYHY